MGQKNAMRDLVGQQAKANAANTATDRATELGATGRVQNVANMLLPTVKPGGAGGPVMGGYPAASMSPYAAATYSGNMRNIADTYANQRMMGMRALGQSGFGNSPGAISSLNSTLGRAQGSASTDAYTKALNDSLSQMVEGANIEQGISGQYGGQSQNESQMATGQAGQRVGMGSTAGDVLSGVSMLAQPIMNAINPTGFANIGKNLSPTSFNQSGKNGFANINRFAPTGVGSYAPTPQGPF